MHKKEVMQYIESLLAFRPLHQKSPPGSRCWWWLGILIWWWMICWARPGLWMKTWGGSGSVMTEEKGFKVWQQPHDWLKEIGAELNIQLCWASALIGCCMTVTHYYWTDQFTWWADCRLWGDAVFCSSRIPAAVLPSWFICVLDIFIGFTYFMLRIFCMWNTTQLNLYIHPLLTVACDELKDTLICNNVTSNYRPVLISTLIQDWLFKYVFCLIYLPLIYPHLCTFLRMQFLQWQK